MVEMPEEYYNRFDPTKEYEEHLHIAGRHIQSAEANEVQKNTFNVIKNIADSLFKDGDIVRDGGCSVDALTGDVILESGALYINGRVRGVEPATFTIPIVGEVAIGIRLVESIVTVLEDPTLKDPAVGTRAFEKEGAERLKVHAQWGWDGDGVDGTFYAVYSVVDGFLSAKEPPPNLDAFNQALSQYDRDSAGGTYVVNGLNVTGHADIGSDQVYTIAEGRARVYGYGIQLRASRRLLYSAVADLRAVVAEPMVSATEAAQRVDLDFTPISTISKVVITKEVTRTIVHGITTGAIDPLPDTSVLSVSLVQQGATTFVATTDYVFAGNSIDWSPAGAEPAPGSSYDVTYQYLTEVTPTNIDATGYDVTGAVVGTLILTDYTWKLPRIDRLCLDTNGQPVWLQGVSAAYNPQPPSVPPDLLALASVYQTWTAARVTKNDAVRVVPMPELNKIDSRIDLVIDLLAQQRLESSIHTRENGAKKGLFVDPFLSDYHRDAGQAQDAAVVSGQLMLPIVATVVPVTSDITDPETLAYTTSTALEQTLRTGSMKINPYMAFAPDAGRMRLVPNVDRWTETIETWASASTSRLVVGTGDQFAETSDTRNVLLSKSVSAAEELRQISISVTLSGFGAGENLTTLTFDGIDVDPGGLSANGSGVISTSFMIPAGVPTGTKEVYAEGAGGTTCRAFFTGQGKVEREQWQQQTIITETRWQSPPPPAPPAPTVRVDPLAQTFTPHAPRQIAGVQLWFSAAPTTDVIVQIRQTVVGFPDQNVVAATFLAPGSVNVGGTPTQFDFDYPVPLLGGVEYAIVALCNDAVGALSVAELGKFDATAQKWVTSQPFTIGVLLSSSNASTWTAHQDKDMAFRLLGADFTENTRTINLGNAAVVDATDLLLMAYAELPSSTTYVEYRLTLPDTSTLIVGDGQPVQLAAAITGNVGIEAILYGDTANSPILFPGTQLVYGEVQTTGVYITRAFDADAATDLRATFEAIVPSGAGLTVEYKGVDLPDAYAALTQIGTGPADDGFTEFTYEATPISETGVFLKITLTGTAAARPRLRDLRGVTI